MKCLKPIIAWNIGTHYNDKGQLKNTIVFKAKEALEHLSFSSLHKHEIAIPCGKCEACLKNKRLEQSLRITHEIEQYEENCFITLTYNNDNLPYTDGKNIIRGVSEPSEELYPTLCIEDYQKWLKRFRKRVEAFTHKKIRYFIVGEYGSKGQRPHYHAIIFGWKPHDLKEHKFHGGYWTYRSEFIEKTWKLGFSEVGINVNAGVAKYCAQYVTKKFVKHDRPKFVLDEFVRSSKMNGGIGSKFLHRFHKQISEQGYILSLNRKTGQGYKSSIPKYYLTLLEKFYKDDYEKLQSNKECYLEQVKNANLKKSYQDWENYFNEITQKVKYYKEMQKKQVRRFENPEQLVS